MSRAAGDKMKEERKANDRAGLALIISLVVVVGALFVVLEVVAR